MLVSVIAHTLQGATEFSIAEKRRSANKSHACGAVDLRAPVRRLNRGEALFQAGDRKTHLYRVESGCLCVYEPHSQGHRVEFAFAGELLGLGYLKNHTRSARAIGETQVTCLPLTALDRLIEGSSVAHCQLERAIDDEVEFVRASLVGSGERDPIARVAAFLVALSLGNSYEGRSPNIITDTVRCGVVAGYLALSVDTLAGVLVELEERGLIENCPPLGLRLNDLNALEQLGDSRAVEWLT